MTPLVSHMSSMLNDVLRPLSTQSKTSVFPAAVPSDTSYFVICVANSMKAGQLADRVVSDAVYEISSPTPSLTMVPVGGEISITTPSLLVTSETLPAISHARTFR